MLWLTGIYQSGKVSLRKKNDNTVSLLLIFFPKPALVLLCSHLLSGFLCSYTARAASAALFGVVVYLHYVYAKVIRIHTKFLPMPWIWGKCQFLELCWETLGKDVDGGQVWSTICRLADGEKELGKAGSALWVEGWMDTPKEGRTEQIFMQNLPANF